jgi:FkbM family methyltransferase
MFKPARNLLKSLGLEVRRVRLPSDNDLAGTICRVSLGDESAEFFVSDDRDLMQGSFTRGEFYEVEELLMLRDFLPRGGVFVDVGANVGNHSVYLGKARMLRKIICFEPNPAVFRLLSLNVRLNCLYDHCELHEIALSNDLGNAKFARPTHLSQGVGRLASMGEIDVRVERGDVFCASSEPDVIKIDVEGHEVHVLNGMERTIRKHQPIVFVEVWDRNFDAFYEILHKFDYEVYWSAKRYEDNENFIIRPA